MSGSIDVGQLTQAIPTPTPETAGDPLEDLPVGPPKVNGSHVHGAAPATPHDSQSVGERLAQRRRQRGQEQTAKDYGQQKPESDNQKPIAGGVRGLAVDPLDLTLDLIHELTHNQRQYRPNKDIGGVNLSILQLPYIVSSAFERIKARVPARCGTAPIATACIEWGLKGMGQYPAVQRLLWLKSVFQLREAEGGKHEQVAGLALSRAGRSLYGVRGQILHQMFHAFKLGFVGERENVSLPLDVYTDLKEVMQQGLGLDLQDGAVLAIMYTLIDVASNGGNEATRDVTVEEDRLEMRAVIDRFLDHAQVRGEAAEAMMMRWGMLESREGDGK